MPKATTTTTTITTSTTNANCQMSNCPTMIFLREQLDRVCKIARLAATASQKKHSESEFDLSSGLWVLHATQVVPHCRHFSLTRLVNPNSRIKSSPTWTSYTASQKNMTIHDLDILYTIENAVACHRTLTIRRVDWLRQHKASAGSSVTSATCVEWNHSLVNTQCSPPAQRNHM